MNYELKICLIEEYSNEVKPTDGEIYRKIRGYHLQRNLFFERRWWTRLTPHGTKNLRQLLRHDELTAAFDALLDISGLWDGMRISVLHKVMAIRCDEARRPYPGIFAITDLVGRKSYITSMTSNTSGSHSSTETRK